MAKIKDEDLVKGILGLIILNAALWCGERDWKTFLISLVSAIFIVIVCRKWFLDVIRVRDAGMAEIDKMDGVEFEEHLAYTYRCLGYTVEITPAQGDQGADLVLERDGIRTVVQAKRWSQPVGNKAVQEVCASIKYYGAQDAIVVTSNTFTESAKELARANGTILIDRHGLIKLKLAAAEARKRRSLSASVSNCVSQVSHASPTQAGSEVAAGYDTLADQPAPLPVTDEPELCPRCKGPLVPRVSKRGPFLGCSSFPRCRYTRDLPLQP
jgi:restriction system protein